MSRLLLLLPTRSYKASEFLDAARALGVEVVVATDRRQALADEAGPTTLLLDFESDRVNEELLELHRRAPFAAVLGVDDDTTVAAATIAAALGLAHDSVDAVGAARDKVRLRRRQHAESLPAPAFRVCESTDDPEVEAARTAYPCVLKPTSMSASRGVIRADDPAAFIVAFDRIARLLERTGSRDRRILVEGYLNGFELALEGLLDAGRLHPLALFDKPDPLTGPYFEETLYVSPARVAPDVRAAAVQSVARACGALGLRTGPVHAEVRFPTAGEPVVLDLAPRTIGGMCGRALRFPGGRTLAEVVLTHLLQGGAPPASDGAVGVLMLPIPARGVLLGVDGLDRARDVDGIREIRITVATGQPVEPLPDGDRYLGFVFAEADDPDTVESALRAAGDHLTVRIEHAEAG